MQPFITAGGVSYRNCKVSIPQAVSTVATLIFMFIHEEDIIVSIPQAVSTVATRKGVKSNL